MNILKTNFSSVLLIVLLTVVTWHKVLFQAFMGEGYYYFVHGYSYNNLADLFHEMVFSFDNGAKFLYDGFSVVFRERLVYYQAFLLLSVVAINTIFYFVVLELTRNKKVAFWGSIFFSVNYVGFQMFATGNYQFFTQRTLSLLFLFPALFYFIRFVRDEHKSTKQYLLSLFFYGLSFFLFHFSLFFVPFFICVFLIHIKISRRRRTDLLRYVFKFIPYLLIPLWSMFNGRASGFMQGVDIFSFFSALQWRVATSFMQQVTIVTAPEGLLSYLSHRLELSHGTTAHLLLWPTIALYVITLFALLRLRKKETNLVRIALWSLASLPVVLLMNLYIRWEMTYDVSSGSRYLYFPAIAVSIYWAIVFFEFIPFRTSRGKIILLTLLSLWSILNIRSVWRDIDGDLYKHRASLATIAYVRTIDPKLKDDSVVIVPDIMGYYGSYFLQKFFGKSKTSFYPMFSDWPNQMNRPFDITKDFIIDYDYEAHALRDNTHAYRDVYRNKGVSDVR